jgi:murein L,D-transpeptidase YcbB/YkuD
MPLKHWLVLLVLCGLTLAGHAQPPTDSLSWFAAGRPLADAWQAVDLLAAADADGLVADDYQAATLRRALTLTTVGPVTSATELADVDRRLTAAMLRYLTELHSGRVDPQQIHENFDRPASQFDPATALQSARATHRLPDLAQQAAPSIPLYASLRGALARYRALADHPAWSTPLPPPAKRKLEPGQPWPGLGTLMARLGALGDLSDVDNRAPGLPVPERYEGALVDAVRRFQERHGLTADGVIGRDTLANLDVAPEARARQIEVTMERLRWTPLLLEPRMVVINIPEFVLRAYNVRDGRPDIATTMKVIVGKALDTRTPIFDEDMRYIEFSPYWNVPPSIARAETVPKLRRDARYFGQQGFEFVAGDGRVITALSPASLDAVLRGALRIRQRPGPQNALGDIKFVFPNNDNIYLHHTPTPRLFSRDRRDFSHGCIRVEAPVELAKFVLRNDPDWPEERIVEAMAKGESSTLRLREPVRVLIAYSTVIARGDGRLFFFADLYGHDRLLDDALRQRSGALSGTPASGAQ